MIEKWIENMDNGGVFGALITELYKAFDCLHHKLSIAKLDTYGLDLKSMRLIQQYPFNRKHGKKFFSVILSGQSLVQLFSTSFCVTYFLDGVILGTYAVNSIPYSVNKTKNLVIKEIKYFSKILFQ